eukprot:SAG11_NODE_24649_length_370_cov_0.752768_1_plen_64_part_01
MTFFICPRRHVSYAYAYAYTRIRYVEATFGTMYVPVLVHVPVPVVVPVPYYQVLPLLPSIVTTS